MFILFSQVHRNCGDLTRAVEVTQGERKKYANKIQEIKR